jgi:hypothetical protein
MEQQGPRMGALLRVGAGLERPSVFCDAQWMNYFRFFDIWPKV